MNKYELTVLIHPDLEVDLDAPMGKVRSIVAENGGKITSEDVWGKKRLAYQIGKQNFAVYVFIELEMPAEALLKVSNTLNITKEVLRYLLVKSDEKGRALLEEAEKARAERAPRPDEDN